MKKEAILFLIIVLATSYASANCAVFSAAEGRTGTGVCQENGFQYCIHREGASCSDRVHESCVDCISCCDRNYNQVGARLSDTIWFQTCEATAAPNPEQWGLAGPGGEWGDWCISDTTVREHWCRNGFLGFTRYQQEFDCGAGYKCSSADNSPKCVPTCTEGEKRCHATAADHYEKCENGQWVAYWCGESSTCSGNGQCSSSSVNECSANDFRCLTNPERYETCADHDGDGYLEWGGVVQCASNEKCINNPSIGLGCQCVGDCTGKECGWDGCGPPNTNANCGNCDSGEICESGICVSQSVPIPPPTCSEGAKKCHPTAADHYEKCEGGQWVAYYCGSGLTCTGNGNCIPVSSQTYNSLCAIGVNTNTWTTENSVNTRAYCSASNKNGWGVTCIKGACLKIAVDYLRAGESGDKRCESKGGICLEVYSSGWEQKYCTDASNTVGWGVRCLIGNNLAAGDFNPSQNGQSGDARCDAIGKTMGKKGLCIEIHNANWLHQECSDTKTTTSGSAIRCVFGVDSATKTYVRNGMTGDESCALTTTICTPQTCSQLGAECGSYPDGCCGTTICGIAGACPSAGQQCQNKKCVCTSRLTCANYPNSCGTFPDNCGGTITCTCATGTCNPTTKLCEVDCQNGQTRACTVSFGSCSVAGTQTCVNNKFGACTTTSPDPRIANCAGKECGSDKCGGTCKNAPNTKSCTKKFGTCTATGTQTCGTNGVYGECVAANPHDKNCAGKECGSDKCGGECGSCPPDEQCTDGKCAPVCKIESLFWADEDENEITYAVENQVVYALIRGNSYCPATSSKIDEFKIMKKSAISLFDSEITSLKDITFDSSSIKIKWPTESQAEYYFKIESSSGKKQSNNLEVVWCNEYYDSNGTLFKITSCGDYNNADDDAKTQCQADCNGAAFLEAIMLGYDTGAGFAQCRWSGSKCIFTYTKDTDEDEPKITCTVDYTMSECGDQDIYRTITIRPKNIDNGYDPECNTATCLQESCTKEILCPRQLKLPFFTFQNLLIAIVIIVVVYFLLTHKKPKNKKSRR